MIDRHEFLAAIFAELQDDEHICVSQAIEKKDGSGVWFKSSLVTERGWRKWTPEKRAAAWYFCVSAVNGELNAKGSMIGRGRANLTHYYCLVLDDIGTKGAPPPVEPAWKVTTSIVDGVKNEQWGYMLEAGDDWPKFEAAVEWCATQGWSDAGAGGSYRLMRVPGSANMKPGRDEFRSLVTHWEEEVWPLPDLVKELGGDWDALETKELGVKMSQGAGLDVERVDPMLVWLAEQERIVNDNGEWIDVVCPWADSHTSGADTAGYSPLGRGSGDWVKTRAFKCLHEHCVDKALKDFVKEMEKEGGPFVVGYDPLPWLQARYAYIGMGQKVIDLEQRKRGGDFEWEYTDWAKLQGGSIMMPGADKPVRVPAAFVTAPGTTVCESDTYVPVARGDDTGIVDKNGQALINMYVPPNWDETTEDPEMFIEHMEYLIPDAVERDNFICWLAHKIQHPDERSYGVCMVADGAFGIGRSWLRSMLSKMVQGVVNTATLPQLIGLGSSAVQNYNDWMARCQFIVVEETKSDVDRETFFHAYETFKTNVDPRVGEARINPKYGKTRWENIYYNCLMFSNHADALPLPENDRRVYVITNETKMNTPEYYERLAAALDNGEPRRLYWWLMDLDVSDWDHIYPPMTPGKLAMVEQNVPPNEAILTWILENVEGDVVTRDALKSLIVTASARLGYDNIISKPGGMVRMIWGKLGNLRGSSNGARYSINGEQLEIRVVRNLEKWREIDEARDIDAVMGSLVDGSMRDNVAIFPRS